MLTNHQLSKLSDIVVDDIDRLFRYFKIPLFYGQSRVYIPCMIHGGDHFNSLNLYIGGGYDMPFIWKCRTHHCEGVFNKSIIGFTRALLSAKQGWTAKGDDIVPFMDTIRFLCDLYKVDIGNIKENPGEAEKNKFVRLANNAQARTQATQAPQGVSREKVRRFLKIPAEYYLKKGYSPEIIDRYDIGYCDSPRSEMYGRTVVPVYDETGKFMIGCTGRSMFEKCEKCECYHDVGACPINKNKYSKWRHNFESRHHLYNYWFALDAIKQTSAALLVESPGNVLKLEMAGIHNSLGMFGNTLRAEQKFLLERAGVMDLHVLLDNDEAGRLGRKIIEEECSLYYNLNFIDLPDGVNDVGEMDVGEIQKLLS